MRTFKRIATAVLALAALLMTTSCDSFYELFIDEEAGEEGVYYAIYDETNTDEEIAAIPDVHLMAADFRDGIKKYGLSYEVTVAFDLETDNEASLSCYYYHNRNEEDAADYCRIGMSFLGTYTMEGDTIHFTFEKEGYNLAFYTVGADYADNEDFNCFSFAEDKGNGIWAYENATWDYEAEAEINEAILEGVPDSIDITI